MKTKAMSASIHYRPTGKEGVYKEGLYLEIDDPGSFIEIVKRGFGKFPVEVGEKDLEKIGEIIMTTPSHSKDFENLSEAIRKNGGIRLYTIFGGSEWNPKTHQWKAEWGGEDPNR